MTQTTQTYQGYRNWQTWNVVLYVGNDAPLYHTARALAKMPGWGAASVETIVRERFPMGTPDMQSGTEYSLVDWSEVAEYVTED